METQSNNDNNTTQDDSQNLLNEGREATRNFKEKFEQLRERARKAGMDIEFNHEESVIGSFTQTRVAEFNTFDTANRSIAPGKFILTANTNGSGFETHQDSTSSGKQLNDYDEDDFFDLNDFANYVFLEIIEKEIEKQEKQAEKTYTKTKRKWDETLEEIQG